MTALIEEEHTKTETTVGKVIEITAESPVSFEDAIGRGIRKAAETVEDIRSAWVEGMQVTVHEGVVMSYRVDLKVTFLIH